MAAKTTAANITRGAPSVAGIAPAGNVLTGLLAKGRPLVMGVLNVTPDSFSDGGHFLEPTAALAQARRLVDQGARILDFGARTRRPPRRAPPARHAAHAAVGRRPAGFAAEGAPPPCRGTARDHWARHAGFDRYDESGGRGLG